MPEWFWSLSYKTNFVKILLTYSKTYADCDKVLALILFQRNLDRKKLKWKVFIFQGIYILKLFVPYIFKKKTISIL